MRIDGHGRCARARGRDGRHDPRRPGRSPATCCSSTPARPSPWSPRVTAMTERTDFLYPFIEGDEHDADDPARRPRHVGRGQGRGQRRAPGRHAWTANAAVDRPPPPMPWPRRSRRAGACSRSATAAARPTPPRSPRCSPDPPWGSRALPARSPGRRHGRAHRAGNDVGFDLVFSRQLIAHAGRVTSPSACRRAATRATCSSRSPRRAGGAAHRRPRRVRRRRDGDARATSTTASWSAPTASTASRRRRPRWRRAVGRRCRSAHERGR